MSKFKEKDIIIDNKKSDLDCTKKATIRAVYSDWFGDGQPKYSLTYLPNTEGGFICYAQIVDVKTIDNNYEFLSTYEVYHKPAIEELKQDLQKVTSKRVKELIEQEIKGYEWK